MGNHQIPMFIFHHFNSNGTSVSPCLRNIENIDDNIDLEIIRQELIDLKLFPTHKLLNYQDSDLGNKKQLYFLTNHFAQVFDGIITKDNFLIASHYFYRVILTKKQHTKIEAFINEYRLDAISNLIYELIAISQFRLINNLSNKTEKRKKDIKSFNNEINALTNSIKKFENNPASLNEIKFNFNDDVFTIKNGHLLASLINGFKTHYGDLYIDNWEDQLESAKEFNLDIYFTDKYKKILAKSFYNLLTKERFYKLEESKTPTRLMICVAKFLEFSLIPINISDEDTPKIVRNWITR